MSRLVLIDGSNLYESAKSISLRIDYKLLLDLLNEDGQLQRAYYFTALPPKEQHSQIRILVDWLGHNGYVTVRKDMKEYVDAQGHRKVKGNVDVDIANYAWMNAAQVTEIYLFSGDGDFASLVKETQLRFSMKWYVVSSMKLASNDLRMQADKFIDLEKLRGDIEQRS